MTWKQGFGVRVLCLAAAILVIGSQIASAATLDRVKASRTFKIGYRADAKPYSYRNDKGEPAGYIVDLCREVAAAVGKQAGVPVRAEFIAVPADQRFEAVRQGRIDILCDPSSVTIERRALVDFSLPTYLDGASVLTRTGHTVQRYQDLAGKRVGVLAGTTTERLLRDSLAALNVKAEVITVHNHHAGMDLLAEDKADAYFADRAIVAALLNEGGRPGFVLGKSYFSYETYALALPRDDGAFRLLVDRTLAQLYRSGRIDAILARTFGKAPPDEMLRSMILINSLPER